MCQKGWHQIGTCEVVFCRLAYIFLISQLKDIKAGNFLCLLDKEIAMKETTPDRYRCATGLCPATFDLEDGRVLIIGKRAMSPFLDEISGRIGDDEYAIIVDAAMLENVSSPENASSPQPRS